MAEQPLCWECLVVETGYVFLSAFPSPLYRCHRRNDLPGCFIAPGPTDPEPPPPEAQRYYVNLPGLQDIIRVPPLEDKALRRERYQRFMDSQTVLPEKLRWIPGVVNMLDDAQDILITGLLLARPLLRRLPARFVPGLGWVLLANDIVNLSTALLGAALGGRSFKRATLNAMETIGFKRARVAKKATDFLEKGIPWFPAVLQGGQALETLTGYGLALGSIMGFITSGIWGTLRYATGEDLSIRGVPRNDVLGKSFRVLSQSWQIPHLRNVLSQEETDLLIAANNLAAGFWTNAHIPGKLAADYNAIQSDTVPWNDNRFASEFKGWLNEKNIKWTEDELRIGFAAPDPSQRPTISDVARFLRETAPLWELDQRERYGPTTHGTTISLLYSEFCNTAIEFAAGERALFAPIFKPLESDAAAAVEYCIRLNGTPTPETVKLWLENAHERSAARGYKRATFEDLKTAASEVAGGYVRIAPATFNPDVHH